MNNSNVNKGLVGDIGSGFSDSCPQSHGTDLCPWCQGSNLAGFQSNQMRFVHIANPSQGNRIMKCWRTNVRGFEQQRRADTYVYRQHDGKWTTDLSENIWHEPDSDESCPSQQLSPESDEDMLCPDPDNLRELREIDAGVRHAKMSV